MIQHQELVKCARDGMAQAYAPYSKFRVGAAIKTARGKIYTGCNVENVSFGGTVCAERVALWKAVSEGEREFEAVAIVNSSEDVVYPCGFCRQVMAEFAPKLHVIVASPTTQKVCALNEILPYSFDHFVPNEKS